MSSESLVQMRAKKEGNVKITDLFVTLYEREPLRGNYPAFFGGPLVLQPLAAVTIETDEGVRGHAFLGSTSGVDETLVSQVVKLIKPSLIGRDPLDIGAIWQDLWKRRRLLDTQAIGVIDVALWDIAGKVANLPIHRLLGTCRDKIPVYASSWLLPRAEDYAEEALHYRDLGWKAYKIHPKFVAKEDIKLCAAVRKAVGDDMDLMLDPAWSYDYEDALRVGLAIQELGYYWYEDPLAETDLYGYVKLRQKLNIPILATERLPGGLYAYSEWIREMATDMLRGDVALKGGITPLVKIAHLAEAFHMKCELHHAFNILNNVAGLHVAMAIPNCEYFEMLLPFELHEYGLVERLSEQVDTEGYLHAPTRPGLGYDIDWNLVARGKVVEVR